MKAPETGRWSGAGPEPRAARERSAGRSQALSQAGLREVLGLALGAALLVVLTLWTWGYTAGFAAINHAGRPLPDALLSLLTYAGDTLTGLVIMLLLAHRHPRLLWTALIAGVVATVLSHAVKHGLSTGRPSTLLEAGSFRLLGPAYRRQGFPSGHTTTAFVMATSFMVYGHRAWQRWLAAGAALLVGLSRVWVGAHWPIDVLGGVATGSVSTLLAVPLTQRWAWGANGPGRVLLSLALAGCAVALWFVPPPYPLATPGARLLAVAALAALGWYAWGRLRASGRLAPPNQA